MALENVERNHLRSRLFFAIAVGVVSAALTSALIIPSSMVIGFNHLLVGSPPTRQGYAMFIFVTFLIMPGMIAAMALSSNVHAFHWWVAAMFNGFAYFGMGWVLHGIAARFRRRR